METTKKRAVLDSLLIGLKLLLICAVIAGIVSFVYSLTLKTYEANIQNTKNAAIGKIFSKDAPDCKELAKEKGTVVYEVYEKDQLIGYCVESTANGFGGSMGLMIGYTTKQTVVGVELISHSETPGLGSKAGDAAFLSQFKDQSGEIAFGEGVDAISGATVSSEAVLEGVNRATAALQEALNKKGGAANA